jgi:hypothetical protein
MPSNIFFGFVYLNCFCAASPKPVGPAILHNFRVGVALLRQIVLEVRLGFGLAVNQEEFF